jgi:Tfp pilus assembly protein FimT
MSLKKSNKNIFNRKGYFLIDVLAVISIISLIAVASVPYIRSFRPGLEISSVKKQIASDLRYCRQLTVTEQVLHGVKFDKNVDSYKVLKMSEEATSTIKYQELPEGVDIKELLNSTDDLVEFNFYGGVDEACEIILEHTSGDTGRVIIKPSGYIDVQ